MCALHSGTYLAMVLTLLILNNYVYARVQRDMVAQVDSSLQVAASQALADLEDENGRIGLDYTEGTPQVEQVGANGFAMRLTGDDGTVLSEWGRYEAVPSWFPLSSGYATLSVGKTSWRLYSQPVEMESGPTVWLQVAQSLAGVEQALGSLRTQLLLGVPIAMILAGLGGFLLAGRALRPVNQITSTAESISGR